MKQTWESLVFFLSPLILVIGSELLLVDLLVIDLSSQLTVLSLELSHDTNKFRQKTTDFVVFCVFHYKNLHFFPVWINFIIDIVAPLKLGRLTLTGSRFASSPIFIFSLVLVELHFEIAAERATMLSLESFDDL